MEEDRRRRTKQKGGARGWAACSRREVVHRWCTQPRAVFSGWARACTYTIHARRTTRCRLTSGAVLRGLVMLRVRAMAPDTRLPWAQKRRSRQAPCSAPVAQRSWSPDIAVGKRARRTSARRVCYRQTALPIVVTEGCYSCVFLQLQRQQLFPKYSVPCRYLCVQRTSRFKKNGRRS